MHEGGNDVVFKSRPYTVHTVHLGDGVSYQSTDSGAARASKRTLRSNAVEVQGSLCF